MAFLIGLVMGACFGFLLAGICASAKESDQAAKVNKCVNCTFFKAHQRDEI